MRDTDHATEGSVETAGSGGSDPADGGTGARSGPYVVVGATMLARWVCASLTDAGRHVQHLPRPDDTALRTALAGDCQGLAVLLHDDHAVLRSTLAAAHVAPDVPIVASIFDRTVAGQLRRLIPWSVPSTPGDLVASSLAGPCLGPDFVALQAAHDGGRQRHGTAVLREGDRLVTRPWRPSRQDRWGARLGRLSGQLRPVDGGGRILLLGLVGLLVVLLADWAYLAMQLREEPAIALFDAARVVATVGPADPVEGRPGYLVISALAMLVTVALTAAFTAGLVEWLLGPRLVGIVGRRALPRRGHVIVVGLGQVGFRLCQELTALGVPVVGVERSAAAPGVRLARTLRIPVVVGDAEDRAVLERVGLGRARALAAVGSDDLDNLAVAVTARAVAPATRVVLRAGDDATIGETRSLLPLGTTRDVTAAAAGWVVAQLLGERPGVLVADVHEVHLDLPGRGLTPWPTPPRDRCPHVLVGAGPGAGGDVPAEALLRPPV